MKVDHIEGVQTFITERFGDDRGWFTELHNHNKNPNFFPHGIRQISRSESRSETIRGLHFQIWPPMPKLIHVVTGYAFFYIVDVRKNSATSGHHMAVDRYGSTRSSEDEFLFVPPYCAVGFEAHERSVVEYFQGGVHLPDTAMTLRWDDPDLGIDWMTANPILSDKDRNEGMSWQDWTNSPKSVDYK